MMNLSNEIRELSIDELDAVIGGLTAVSPNEQNEQIAHFYSTHDRTTVGETLEWKLPRPTKKK